MRRPPMVRMSLMTTAAANVALVIGAVGLPHMKGKNPWNGEKVALARSSRSWCWHFWRRSYREVWQIINYGAYEKRKAFYACEECYP